jgi:mono/diheme cytochrome c family protein/ketosteroid isomerase-like protein
MNRTLLAVAIVVVVLAALGALVIGAGLYNVAADEAHSPLVYRVLETARERSIGVRARGIEVPDLEDAASVRRGAGNYDAMCAGCHLAPGKRESEISIGLYPAPPNLTKVTDVKPAEAFWVIKHGIKASGMPAWGKRMEDGYIWDMVAFLTKLPALSTEQYAAEVAASGGHSHGGGESGHSHEDGAEPAGHTHVEGEGESDETANEHADSKPMAGTTHTHADGQHAHEAPAGTPVAAVQALHEALSSGNASKVERLLDPKVLILEGGNVERSRREYAAHHLPADLKFMKSVAYKLDRQSGDTVGDLAWVVSEAHLAGNREGKPVDVVSTETLVLKRSAAGWKVVHIHWSSRSGKAH